MKLIKISVCLVMVLFSVSGFAERKEKITICHVGNDLGPNGETYLDDPGCVPIEENGYFCPDAGKIDLISVAKPSKHLNNPSHEFDGISDYLPEDIGASGEGDEDSDGNGIDDGCEPDPVYDCPCFTGEELQALGEPVECGNNFPGVPNLAGAFWVDDVACSGPGCADASTAPSCALTSVDSFVSLITPQEDADCQALIMENCANPN